MSDEWAIILAIIGIMSPIITDYKGQDQTHFRKVYIIHEMDKRIVS